MITSEDYPIAALCRAASRCIRRYALLQWNKEILLKSLPKK